MSRTIEELSDLIERIANALGVGIDQFTLYANDEPITRKQPDGELVSRRAAIDLFENYEDTDGIKIKYVRQMLEGLAPEERQLPYQWIPISVDTPKKDGDYLTTTLDGKVYCDHWTECCFDRTETVIAWMPKPQAYKQPDKRTAEELSNDIRRMATGAGVSIKQTAIYISSQR